MLDCTVNTLEEVDSRKAELRKEGYEADSEHVRDSWRKPPGNETWINAKRYAVYRTQEKAPITLEVGFRTKAIGTAGETWQLTDIIETSLGKEYEFTKLTPGGRLSQKTQRFPEHQVKDLAEAKEPAKLKGMGEEPSGYEGGSPYFQCSKCGAKIFATSKPRFCPSCNAKPFEAKAGSNPDTNTNTFNLLDMVLAWIIPMNETGGEIVEAREDEAL